ncbi:uncharacterized protein G2W53_004053 [Senna tora]|uniref:Retrotransposon gag domain-containing protein n=1 Tax=Senna tora TaxID=362788 RepID=A0A835CIZ8_9FABA|nr:uncharacterized protein G2W53_004053 [Senna tora]
MADAGSGAKKITKPDVEPKNLDKTNGGWVLHNSDQPERYSVSNGPMFYQVQRQMVSLEQGGETVTCYFNKLNRSWDELNKIKPVPRCVCGSCTCQVNKKLDEHDSDIKLVQFLMGLHLMYDALRGQILNLDPLPSVNKAFSMVVRQETQKEVNLTFNNVESSAMMARTNGKKVEDKKAEKVGKYCDHWKKAGNTANMVANTPIDFVKEKENIDFVGVLTALQEIAKGQGKDMTEGNNTEFESIEEEIGVPDLSRSVNREEEDLSVDGNDQEQEGEDLSEEGTQELEIQGRPSTLNQMQSPNNNIEQMETQLSCNSFS